MTRAAEPDADGRASSGRTEPECWVLVPATLLPDRWRARSTIFALVPLLPGEAGAFLAGDAVEPEVDGEDQRLLGLLSQAMPPAAIARALGVSVRTVEYRLQRLRERFGVGSTAELATLAAARGFRRLREDEDALRRDPQADVKDSPHRRGRDR